jgi:hypothetical protein
MHTLIPMVIGTVGPLMVVIVFVAVLIGAVVVRLLRSASRSGGPQRRHGARDRTRIGSSRGPDDRRRAS